MVKKYLDSFNINKEKGLIMIMNSINSNMSFKSSDRLMAYDIRKMPVNSLSVSEKEDHYVPRKKDKNPFWTKFFTFASFALTGLYLANRNNLFNPVKREARRILRSEELLNKLKSYVPAKINVEAYNDFTRTLLKKYAADTTRTQDFMSEAQKTLDNKALLDKLCGKVSDKLGDDSDLVRHSKGFISDILDGLGLKIEKLLLDDKKKNLPYKDKQGEFIGKLFDPNNSTSVIDDSIFDIFKSRAGGVVEDFVNEAVTKSKVKNA